MTEEIERYRNQVTLARTEIKNLRQQLSALKHEHQNEVKLIKTALESLRCANCAFPATTHVESQHTEPESSTSEKANSVLFKPIGIIETLFPNKRGVPRQPSVVTRAKGTVVIDTAVFNNPKHALAGLEEFSHMWIIFNFHVMDSKTVSAKVSPPRLCGERRGIFSTRSPHRPNTIGLSLVKIHSIEGNKIHFLGVDMVNGTPVLDIKPYIPQYDMPGTFAYNSSLVRPPTEGTSDIIEVPNVQNDDEGNSEDEEPKLMSLNSHMANVLTVETGPLSQSSSEDETPSPDDPHIASMAVSPFPESSSSAELLERDFRTRSPSNRPDTERGAPDGQERFTPPQSALINLPHDGIRVAPWISSPPSQTFQVRFTDDAEGRLNDLIGDRAEAFKDTIKRLLAEDPRSQYVRSRYPDHEYSCVLEDLSVTCVFDASSSLCTILALRNADDLQDN